MMLRGARCGPMVAHTKAILAFPTRKNAILVEVCAFEGVNGGPSHLIWPHHSPCVSRHSPVTTHKTCNVSEASAADTISYRRHYWASTVQPWHAVARRYNFHFAKRLLTPSVGAVLRAGSSLQVLPCWRSSGSGAGREGAFSQFSASLFLKVAKRFGN